MKEGHPSQQNTKKSSAQVNENELNALINWARFGACQGGPSMETYLEVIPKPIFCCKIALSATKQSIFHDERGLGMTSRFLGERTNW